jgi:glyoxylase-like metal-dependent hydrolase (beta-lactamase superfamily II)
MGVGYDSNIFVISGKKPTIIDTGTGMHKDSVIKKIENYIDLSTLSQIILTHEHFDHTGGVKQLYDASGNQPSIIAHRVVLLLRYDQNAHE